MRASLAASLSLLATAASTFLMQVLTLDLIALFLAVLISVTNILFLADLMLANLYTSNVLISIIVTLLQQSRTRTVCYKHTR